MRCAALRVGNMPYCCLGPVALNLKYLCQVTSESLQQRDAGRSRKKLRQEVAGGARRARKLRVGADAKRGHSMSIDVRPVLRSPQARCVFATALCAGLLFGQPSHAQRNSAADRPGAFIPGVPEME